jgi:hypothetical protein
MAAPAARPTPPTGTPQAIRTGPLSTFTFTGRYGVDFAVYAIGSELRQALSGNWGKCSMIRSSGRVNHVKCRRQSG